MARRKTETVETPATTTKPPRTRRRKAAAATPEATKPRRRKAAAATPEATKPRRRGRPAKAATPAKANSSYVYTGKYQPVWDMLPDDKRTPVRLNPERDPRGAVQKLGVAFVTSRGRRKTTAQMVINDLMDSADRGEVKAAKDVSHWLNCGLLQVAE